MTVLAILTVVALVPSAVAVGVGLAQRPLQVTLPLFAFTLPFGSSVALAPTKFGTLSSIIGLALGAGLLAQLATARHGATAMSPTVAGWALFLAWTGLTMAWTVAPSDTVSGFFVLASLVSLYVLVAISDIDNAAWRRTLGALVAGSLLTVGYGLVQLTLLGGFPPSSQGVERFGNGLLEPNNQAAAMLVPLALTASWIGTAERRRTQLLSAAATALLLLGIVMTGSRGGLLSALGTLVLVVIVSPSGRRRLLTYGGVGLVVLGAVLWSNPGGLGARLVEAEDATGRTDIWRVGINACETYCLNGSGWGTFSTVYQQTLPSTTDAAVTRGGAAFEAHNIWLLVAVEAGVVGLLLVVVILGLTLRDAWRLPAVMRTAVFSGLVGTWLSGLFLSNLEFKFFWMALILLPMAGNVSLARAERQARPHQSVGHEPQTPADG